jgi:beta-galactosidase
VRPPLAGAPPGVEAVRRGERLFLLNHARTPASVAVDGRAVELAARDAAVLEVPEVRP